MYTLSSFYRSDEWAKFREYVINKRTTPEGLILDEVTGKPILKRYDIILHHKIILTEQNVNDPSITLNEDNIQIVSHKTHNQIHNRFGYEGTRHIYIVYGCPCSGKSTYVEEVAGANDIILDIDKLYKAISINPLHTKSKKLSKNIFILRDTILDMVKTRTGKWENAYIIGGYPLASERERLANTLGAELMYIDRDIEECKQVALQERSKEYLTYIDNWHDQYLIR